MVFDPLTSPLLTDLYQLTMLQGYVEEGMNETAVFELFVRKLPPTRGFLMSAGLESVLDFLERLSFSEEEVSFLAKTGRFSDKLLDYLRRFRFTGNVHALPEGTVFFENEPIIRITAPLPEAQFVETRLMNLLHLQILLASKAARCVLAAAGRSGLVDFGLRRTHGAEAGLFAARSSFVAGFAASSNVLAESLFAIPVSGTMAHSFVESHEDEGEAFIRFAFANPDNVTLLIDTYDTLEGARKAVETSKYLRERGIGVQAVRLDSGDLLRLSLQVRQILDAGGLAEVKIFVSGNMDEYAIAELLDGGAPIDGFGVGTKLDTSEDAPYLECAYKLMEYAGRPRLKKSEGKATWPGRKQVFRSYEEGRMRGDLLTLDGDVQAGIPLLKPVMKDGERLSEPRSLKEIASVAKDQLDALPVSLRMLKTEAYPVMISDALNRLRESTEEALG
ncbi:MAG: nicotinate phosphoribosyltransferase [Deltaproteobacteria bacterium]|nr:nicotinate phosphoribosyltransferase [Deltaproteobacteria bacterium]